MEIKNCNICGRAITTVFELPKKELCKVPHEYMQKIGICERCGFIFTQNPFSQEILDDNYKNNSIYEFDLDTNTYRQSLRSSYIKRCERQKNFLSEMLHDFDSIAEIGAASGYNLSLYKNKKALGIEPSKANCESALTMYGLNMFQGTFEEYYYQGEKERYELVFLSHTLEHIVNPCDFVRKCFEAFSNLYFFVEVPCFDVKFEDEPFGMFNEEHVNCFTLEALRNLFSKIGFKLTAAQMNYDIFDKVPSGIPSVSTLWELTDENICYEKPIVSSKLSLELYLNSSKERIKDINKKIAAIDDHEKLAVWGVSYTTATLLANTCLGSKNIVKYYDSDKRKSGMQYNGRTIFPFSENDILNGEVEGILVGSYAAQREIYDMLIPYQDKVKVYCLFDDLK